MKTKTFNQIYKEYSDELLRFARFKTGSVEEAQDLVAEVFIKLYSQEEGKVENPRAWLYRVTRNQIYDRYVKKKSVEYAPVDDEEMQRIADESGIVEDSVINDTLIELVGKELKQLDSDTSDIIAMKIWDEMSFTEIAAATGLSVSNVKQKYYRGVESMNKNVNLKSVALPALVLAIYKLGKITIPGKAASAALASSVSTTLNISLQTMTASQIFSGLLTTSAGKIAVVTTAGVVTLAGTIGAATLFEQANLPQSEASPVISYPNSYVHTSSTSSATGLSRYESSNFEFAFEYNESDLGKATGSYRENKDEGFFCNSETVSFADYSGFDFVYISGTPECIGYGGNVESMKSKDFNLKSGEKVYATLVENPAGAANRYTATAESEDITDFYEDGARTVARIQFTGNDLAEAEAAYAKMIAIMENTEVGESAQASSQSSSHSTDAGAYRFEGQTLNVAFDYDYMVLGEAKRVASGSNQSRTECIYESVEFPVLEVGVSIDFLNGPGDCLPHDGSESIVQSETITSKSGKKFLLQEFSDGSLYATFAPDQFTTAELQEKWGNKKDVTDMILYTDDGATDKAVELFRKMTEVLQNIEL